ncbi:MAG: hypothetical protein IPM21_10685 [Acidobacteria bacterium]|nr:hypothetical protein [Acidobacteriota bacterium]
MPAANLDAQSDVSYVGETPNLEEEPWTVLSERPQTKEVDQTFARYLKRYVLPLVCKVELMVENRQDGLDKHFVKIR